MNGLTLYSGKSAITNDNIIVIATGLTVKSSNDKTGDMIHLNDSQGRIIYSNHATETVLGYSLKEILNTSAFDIIHPDDRDAVASDMQSISSGGDVPPIDIRLLKKALPYSKKNG